jgi:hypothetical protein
MFAAAPVEHQYAVLAGFLLALAFLCRRRPGALFMMAVGAVACGAGMSRFVAEKGNTINTDASPLTGPILVGALLGLFLYFTFSNRTA